MAKILSYFKEQGGIRLIKEYLQNGVFLYAVGQILLTGFSKKSLELLRLGVDNKLQKKLKKRYCHTLKNIKNNQVEAPSKKIWIFWMQGLDNAPIVVKHCYKSVCEHLTPEYEIVLLTDENRRQYVVLPDFIEEKYKKGYIGNAHFADILRVALLAEHGGTWMDATVLVTGKVPSIIMDADFFMFQNICTDDKESFNGISNWFISAKKGNKIIIAIRDLLYLYWEEHDRVINYFFFHHMMVMIQEEWPNDWELIYKYPNSAPHILLLMLFNEFDSKRYDAVKSITSIHKLSYKFSQEMQEKENTYFRYLFND